MFPICFFFFINNLRPKSRKDFWGADQLCANHDYFSNLNGVVW